MISHLQVLLKKIFYSRAFFSYVWNNGNHRLTLSEVRIFSGPILSGFRRGKGSRRPPVEAFNRPKKKDNRGLKFRKSAIIKSSKLERA